MCKWLPILVVQFFFWPGILPSKAAEVGSITINGPIGPATSGYISRSIEVADERNYECLIIHLDTPGGLLESTKIIVQAFFNSPIPTVVYVAPAGATAASAGCFITLAADVAAMSPTTTIGAAHPVTVGGSGEGERDSVMTEKMANYAISFIESIAARRDRNVEWAKSSVKESAAITSERALELNVIEILAEDLPDLLRQLDGHEVNGKNLQTVSAEVREIPMLAREKFFQMFWRPEVMMILMLIAIYGIIGELSNPGAIIPGMVGAIALILVLYMSAILPVNIAGVALIVLAIALFITEIFTPSFGLLTVGGLISFVMGALMLFDTPVRAFRLSLHFIIPAALVTAAFFIFVIGAGLRAQFRPVRVGRETLIGKTTTALSPIDPQSGRIFIEGETWRAISDTPISEGEAVEIIGIEGLTLKVKPKRKES